MPAGTSAADGHSSAADLRIQMPVDHVATSLDLPCPVPGDSMTDLTNDMTNDMGPWGWVGLINLVLLGNSTVFFGLPIVRATLGPEGGKASILTGWYRDGLQVL